MPAKDNGRSSAPTSASGVNLSHSPMTLLHRKCACGSAPAIDGECAECRRQRLQIQTKLTVNQPGDRYEQEADQVADQVMHMAEPAAQPLVQRQAAPPAAPANQPVAGDGLADQLQRRQGEGRPLPTAVRTFMEGRFGADFSQVRVHTDAEAEGMSRQLGAQAFTHQQAIYYGPGHAPANDALTAHELAHVVQQSGGKSPSSPSAHAPAVQRVIELRPPGRGEASAFDRRQELIDRLNTFATAIQYRLDTDGRRVLYDIVDETALTHFDRQMRAFIDRAEVTPLRLITSAGRVANGSGGFDPLLFDSFVAGYMDLDDLLASDDHALRLVLLHLLTERFQVRDYARRIGTDIGPLFARAHRAGRQAEVDYLRDFLNDPTIRHNYDEPKPNGTLVIAFRSNEGYRVFHVIRRADRELSGGSVFVQMRDGRRLTLDELRAERAAVVAPAAP